MCLIKLCTFFHMIIISQYPAWVASAIHILRCSLLRNCSLLQIIFKGKGLVSFWEKIKVAKQPSKELIQANWDVLEYLSQQQYLFGSIGLRWDQVNNTTSHFIPHSSSSSICRFKGHKHPAIPIPKVLFFPSLETCLDSDRKCVSTPQKTTFKISRCHYLFMIILIMVSPALHKDDKMTEKQL